MVDFTSLFNPSAWGSWAPSGSQSMVAPQVQQQALPPAQPQPQAIQPMTPQPGQPLPMAQGGQQPQQPTGLPFGLSQKPNANYAMQVANNLMKPPAAPPPLQPMQMARPVGTVQPLQVPSSMGMLGQMFGGR